MNSGLCTTTTAQKKKFSIKDFFSKCNQICRRLCIYLHLLKKSLMENFIFCVVNWNMVLILAVIGNMKPCGSLKKEHTFSTFLLVSFEAFPKHMRGSNWIKFHHFSYSNLLLKRLWLVQNVLRKRLFRLFLMIHFCFIPENQNNSCNLRLFVTHLFKLKSAFAKIIFVLLLNSFLSSIVPIPDSIPSTMILFKKFSIICLSIDKYFEESYLVVHFTNNELLATPKNTLKTC